jgi:uncharacterized peroxidase-related enzyme
MRLKTLPADGKVYDVFASRPEIFGPFTEACEQIMRGPSALSPADRELLGTYVSGLNDCPYCHDVHNEAVKAYGIDGKLSSRLREDLEKGGFEPRLKPIFALAKKMTESAYRVTDADFEATRHAGWDDKAIMDAVVVVCLFNFMNRLVSTLGIEADEEYLAAAGPRIRDAGYKSSLDAARQQEQAEAGVNGR